MQSVSNNILDIEKDRKILEYRTPENEPIWFYMRDYFLRGIIEPKIRGNKIVGSSRKKNARMFNYFIKCIIANFQFLNNKKGYKVLFYSICRHAEKDGKFYNKYTDYYSDLLPNDCLTVEHPSLDWHWEDNRHNNNVIFCFPWLLRGVIASKLLGNNLRKPTRDLIDYLSSKVSALYNISLSDEEKDNLLNKTINEIFQMEYFTKYFVHVCKKHAVQLVIIVPGPYTRYCKLIKELKNLGINTSFLQDGIKTRNDLVGHINSNLLMTDDVMMMTPDIYFTLGRWWNDKLNLPYKYIIPLGNPSITTQTYCQQSDSKNLILIIGTNNSCEDHFIFANKLQDRFQNFQVIFRPHPSERVQAEQLSKKYGDVKLDMSGDLYQELPRTEVLISEVSTVLFEAIGVVPKILVWRTEYSKSLMPDCPFNSFNSIEDIENVIDRYTAPKISEDEIWLQDYKEAFMNVFHKFCNKG